MKLSSTRTTQLKPCGFTLLEMLVVLLLVALLSSLLMQGFIYLSGVHQAVERRQERDQRDALLSGWLRDSIGGLVNGVDGSESTKIVFTGDSSGFSGIGLVSLSGRYQGLPVQTFWQIERSSDSTRLVYRESPLYGGVEESYVIREWSNPSLDARWVYWSDGGWKNNYPEQSSVFSRNHKHALPRAIGLIVNSTPYPLEILVAVRASSLEYRPPTINGVL